jgi:hypothetical protein
VQISEERIAEAESVASVAMSSDAGQRSKIQFQIVAQRDELRVALARVLRERWRGKAATGLGREDARSAGDWLEVLSQRTLQTVSEEHEGDRQFALAQVAAAALAALESSQRQHGELKGTDEIPS